METTRTSLDARRVFVPVLLLSLALGLVLSATVPAAADGGCGEGREARCPSAELAAKKGQDGLLDKVGLGSLRDIAWGALPVALALSALIGAAGGFVYSGIQGAGGSKKRTSESNESGDP